MPRISVLMPVYNALPYLRDALNSVLCQSFQDFEVLTLDDASTDGSTEYLDGLRDPRLRVFHLPKAGHAVNLNIGLREARADIIARMDADDISVPHRFERQYSFLQENADCVICGCQMVGIGAGGEVCRSWDWDCPSSDELIRYEMLTGCPFLHPGVMYRKPAVIEAGAYQPGLETAQDYDLWVRLSRVGKMANLPDRLVHYRIHAQSVSATKRAQQSETMKGISFAHVMDSGFAKSVDEFEGFYRCRCPARSDTAPTAIDAHAFARVAGRFIASLENPERSASSISQLRRAVRWKLQTLSRSHRRFSGDRFRMLRLGARFDGSWRAVASLVKSALLEGRATVAVEGDH
jgi:hypothetical protein